MFDGDGKWLEGVYTRVHRDTQIINSMRSWMKLNLINDFNAIGLNSDCTGSKGNEQFLNFIEK